MAGPLRAATTLATLIGVQDNRALWTMGDAAGRWNSAVAGGAFARPEDVVAALNAVAERDPKSRKRKGLSAVGARVQVQGARTTARPVGRA